jgi:hypothetical protein
MTCDDVELELPLALSPKAALHVATCDRCLTTVRAVRLAHLDDIRPPTRRSISRPVLFSSLGVAAVALLTFAMLGQSTKSNMAPPVPNLALPVQTSGADRRNQDAVSAQMAEARQLDLLEDEVFSEIPWDGDGFEGCALSDDSEEDDVGI